MRKILVVATILLSLVFFSPSIASAHRSGCHRWHSCSSDSGSYTCGDTGYCSACPNNYYCKNSSYEPGWQSKSTKITNDPVASKKTVSVPANAPQYYIGTPRTRSDLLNCKIVGNYSSMIYHLRGSSYIKTMIPKNKYCFLTETEARDKGLRKAKVQ